MLTLRYVVLMLAVAGFFIALLSATTPQPKAPLWVGVLLLALALMLGFGVLT